MRTSAHLIATVSSAVFVVASLFAGPVGAESAPPAVAVVVGTHANSVPMTGADLPSALLARWVAEDAQLSVVLDDGRPTLTQSMDLDAQGPNSLYTKELAAAEVRRVTRALGRTRATVSQVATLQAIALASRAVSGKAGPRSIEIMDSGLSTVPPLAFQDGVLNDTPHEVVSFLRSTGELPDLKGITVVWRGMGQVSGAQTTLSIAQLRRLEAIWRAVLLASGARSVTVVSAPLLRSAVPRGLPPVAVVALPPLASLSGSAHPSKLVVTLDPASVDFVATEAVYLDPPKAEAVLATLAQEILAGGYRHVLVTGTTALAPGISLSLARAGIVKEALVQDGVPSANVTTVGVGTDFSGFVPDTTPTGALETAEAQEDRLVIVTATR